MHRDLCGIGEKVRFMPLQATTLLHQQKKDINQEFGLALMKRHPKQWSQIQREKLQQSRSIRRMAESDRWDAEMVQAIKGRPHNLLRREIEQRTILEEHQEQPVAPIPAPRPDMPVPRRVNITKRDMETHGYIENCLGCEAKRRGLQERSHSEKCRNRLIEALRGVDEEKR